MGVMLLSVCAECCSGNTDGHEDSLMQVKALSFQQHVHGLCNDLAHLHSVIYCKTVHCL